MKTFKILVPIIFGVFALFATNAYAGYYYEAMTTTSSDAVSRDNKTIVAVWSEGKSTRIEFREGENMGFFGPGSYLISSNAGETMYLVNPEEKTYSLFDLGQMMNAATQAIESMGGMVKMEITDAHFEKVSEESGGKLLGYPTRHIRFKSGYTTSISIMGMKRSQTFNSMQDIWTTSAVDAPAFNAWLRPDKVMKGMLKGMEEMVDAQFNLVKGAPLKSVIETTSTGGGMGGGGPTKSFTTTEVTTLRKESVPAATFAIPPDYTETALMDEIARESADEEDQEDQEGEMSIEEGFSKFKGIFGR